MVVSTNSQCYTLEYETRDRVTSMDNSLGAAILDFEYVVRVFCRFSLFEKRTSTDKPLDNLRNCKSHKHHLKMVSHLKLRFLINAGTVLALVQCYWHL